jgi:serine/threonine protein kinase
MGMVYLCRDLALDERVALKLFGKPGEATRPEDQWWFQEEARALAGLSHPAIVRARDFGALADGTPFLVMDAAPGRSLHEWIYLAQHDGLLPWPVVWSAVDQILSGLAHAHSRGVIHGDLKPSNVLLEIPPDGGDPKAYILDLGLAWLMQDRIDHRLDGSSEAEPTVRYGAGTPGWMAPEQIRYATPHIGAATDLYALGCILFALISNREPYTGTNEELLAHHRNSPVPEPGVPPGAPKEVAAFTKRLMAKRPWHRFMMTADARRAWRAFKPAESATSTPLPTGNRTRSEVRSSHDLSVLPERMLDAEPAAPPAAGLLALRPSPFVAREEERVRLMTLVRDVATAFPERGKSRGARALALLTGEAGVGKSRIAEWLCEEVHEQGLMIPLRARYRKIPAPLDGVVGAITQHYRLERAEREVVEKVLMNLWGVDLKDDDGTTWVAAAAEWLCPAPAGAKVGPSGKRFALDHPELRWLVMRRTLEKIAFDRPILLWMDDIHLAPPGTYENIARLVLESDKLSVLVVATVRTEAVVAEPQSAERLDAMMSAVGGERLEIVPLDSERTHSLLRETLPLDETAAAEAAARSKGNPLFALQLLHAWAMGGHLEMRDGLYYVPKASLATRASTTADLWEERLAAVPEEFRRAALAAAALGGDIRRDVLRAEYELLGIDGTRAIAVLKRAQILSGSGTERLRWPHALLQEHLLTQLFSRPDAAQIFRAAADALGHHPSAQTRRIVRHRVVNLIRAGAVDAAADLLHSFIAANWGRSRETAATLRDLALLDGRLEGRSAAVQHLWRGEALRHAGRLEDARREGDAARQVFQELGDRRSEATCLRLLGHIASDQAAPALGRRLVSRGLAIFEELSDDHGAAQCEVTLGEIDFLMGDHARARQMITSASARFARAGDRLGYAQSLVVQVFIEQAAGAAASTRDTILTARREFEAIGYRLGMAQSDLTLAHTDHREGLWQKAREVALSARQAFRDLANPRGEAGCERILAMIAIDSEDIEIADEHARAAALLFDKLADPWGQVEVRLLLAQIGLCRGDADAAREHLIACEAVALVESEPKQHRHLTKAWLAYHEGRFHEAARELDAARAAFKDPIRTGDHTPMLLDRFGAMSWPKPAGARVEAWRAGLLAATAKTGRHQRDREASTLRGGAPPSR